jgi:predicted dehydrogenase
MVRTPTSTPRPRLGFVGLGKLGRSRLEAMIRESDAQIAAVADPSTDAAREALALAPQARPCAGLADVLRAGVDGVVLATPSSEHEVQVLEALKAGVAVFCETPLGPTAHEARALVEEARRRDLLLGLDVVLRFSPAAAMLRELVQSGSLGTIFAADLRLHSVRGPDERWSYDRARSGGGCLMDLGIHLVDFALWALGGPRVERASGRLFVHGRPIRDRRSDGVEDFATLDLELDCGCDAHITCSWKLNAGRGRGFKASFYGTEGGVSARAAEGSFEAVAVERHRGDSTETLASAADPWSARAALVWARRLAAGERFDPEVESAVRVAEVLDRVYTA